MRRVLIGGLVCCGIVSLLGISSLGCSSSSDASCGGGGNLTVSVTDSTNNDAYICDATVTVTAVAGMPQTLTSSGPPTGCTYSMQLPQGTYVVAASKAAYQSQQTTLRIGSVDGCHIDSPSIDLGLIHM